MPVQKNERVFEFYQLEDRILLSGDGLDAGDAIAHGDVEILDALMAQMLESNPAGTSDPLFGAHSVDPSDAESDEVDSNERVDTPEFDPSRPLEVVFVDAGVEDAETLLAGLRDHSDDGTQWSIVRLSSDEDGIAQITQTLGELSGVDAIHIVSHGDGEGIQLGNARLDQNSAVAHAGSLAQWQNALDADADLLIYGCELASSDSGRELIEMLAAVCDCDVAASDDLTGHQSLGGDWDLEYAVGSIETAIAFDLDVQHSWQHVFAATADATSTGTSSGGDITISHTTSGIDRLMLVGVSINLAGADQVTSITYNGDALSLVGTRVDGDARVEIWSLLAPDVGTYNVDINFSGTSDGNTAGVMTFTGVDQSTPLGTFASGAGVGGSGSVTVSSSTDDLVFAAIAVDEAADYDLVPGAGQTEAWDLTGGPDINGGGSTETGAASVVMDWTWSGSDNWAAAGVSINSMAYLSASFQEGVSGYTGTLDTDFNGDSPASSYGSDVSVAVDDDHNNGFESIGLLRFDSIFGNGPGQIPLGSTIVSGSLTINAVGSGSGSATLSLHEMLTGWDESSTYNSLGSGLQSGAEYVAAADGSVTDLSGLGLYTITGLEDALQSWSDGGTNHGWALFNSNANGFDFESSEASTASLRPELSVQYIAPIAPVESSIEGTTLAYTENDGAVAITSTLALSDDDDTDLQSAVVQITGNYANGQDVLTFVDQNGISGSWDAGSGTLTLSGTATVAQYEASLRSITYTNTSDNPSTATRTVAFTVNDGISDSNTQTRDISIAATNDDPTGTGLPSDITVTEDVSGNVDLSALNLADLDDNGGNLTVTLTTSTGGDLSASTGGGVTVGGSGTGTLTLTGTLADLNTFLDTPANVQYLHGTPHTFGNDADTIQVVVNDGGNTGSGGGTDQTIGTVNVDITAVNDEQVLATNTGDTVPEGSVGNTVTTAMLETTDLDNTDTQLVYTVDAVPINGTLYRLGTALNVSDTFTQADIDAGLITYDHDGSQTSSDSFDFTVDDGAGTTTSSTFTWTISNVNDAPVEASIEGSTLAYTENDGAVAITSTLTLSDVDDTDLESAVVQITGNYTNGEDVLSFVDQNGISGVWNAGSGTLTLTGTATVAQFEAALRSITYTNSSDNPSTATRTIAFTVSDGDVDSNTQTRDISIAAVNDAPTVATNTGTTVLEGATGTAITTAMLNEGDVDDSGAGLTYTITDVTDNGTMYLAGFGALGLNDTFTQADIDAGDVTYDHDGSETTSDAFSFSLADGGEDGATAATGTFNFTVTAVNDNNPIITSDGGAATAAINVFENSVYVSTVVASDADLPAATLTYSIIGGVDSAQFAIDGSTGVLTFVAAPDFESPTDVGANNVYDVIVQASDGTYTDSQTIAVTVQDTADDGQFLDLFEVDSYSNSDGSEAWSTGWVDSDDGSAAIGNIKVTGGDLRINATNVNDNIYRQVDLSGASSASLDLGYKNSLTGARTVLLQVSGDGGSNYDTVATLDASTNVGTGTLSFDISAYTAADTRVRFLVTAVGGGGAGGNIEIDSLQVGYTPNSAPTITSNGAGATAAVNAAESGTAVTTVTAVDGDVPAQTLTYSIIGGLDSTKFAIDSSSGVLTFVSAPNFESPTDNGGNNVYDVTVQVTDGIDTDTQSIAVTVTDVNESPTIATNTGTTVLEGSTGTAITTAMLNEGDVDDTGAGLTYTITNVTDNGTMYLAGFGALALNDTFTQANIDAGDVTYDHDGSETVSDAFNFSLADGGEDGATPATGTFNFTVTAVNDAAVEASIEGSTLSYTENAGAVAITSTLALTDVDDTNLESAVVQITGNYANGQDVLTFVDQNGISGVWNAGAGTMTLTGTATVAQYEAALRSITYTNTSDNPSTATRTVAFTVNDGDVDSNTQTRDISIAATNDDPTGTGLPSDITMTEDVSSNVDLSALNLSDLDDNGGNLTVTLSTSTGGDLSASTGGGVTVGGSGTGTLTLTGSLADLNTFLDTPANVQYLHGTPHTFGNDADTIQVVVNDGGNTGSGGGTDQTIGTVNVDISAVNDEQVVVTNVGDTVVEGTVGNFISTAMLETTDVDNTDSQLVYTVDALPTNGTLLLSGSSLDVNDTFTQADIDAGLLSYDHDGSEATTDSFGFTVDDGAGTTTSSTFNWTILPVNDAPVEASIEGSTLAYTENDGAVAITSTLALGDVDDTNLESAVVQITGNYASGQDVLSFVDQNGISGVWNAGSGTMTLSGTATVAEYEAALRSITYTNSSDNPSTATRTVSFTVNDGDVDSNTQTRDISIAATNDDPTGTGLPSDITVTEDVSSNVDLSALNLSDLDENGGNLTVTLSTSTGGDLSASTGGGVTVGGSGTGTLILTGSLADLNTFLDTPANVQYLHGTPNTFGNDADTIQVVVNDGGNTGSGGGTDQTIGTVNVDITAVNDEQVLATNAGDTVAEGSTGNTVTTAMLETTDVDNTDSQLVYTVDVLPSNGTLYRSGVVLNVSDTFTQADIDANLITYDHDGSGTTSDSFDLTVDDGAGTTTSSTFNWTVTAVNDAPVEASIEGSTLAYTENGGAVAITSTLALSDVDDTNLESAVIQITGNYTSGQDELAFVDQNGISGVWNAGAGTMTLTGTATVAQYEAALRSITYTNTSDNPSTATRTVAFTVNDGDVDSNTQTRDISIAATNDDPTGTGLPSDITVSEDVSSNVDLSALNLSDLDENGGNLTVTLSTSTGGDLSASTGGGVTVGGSGTGTLTLAGSLADLNTFLDTPANVQYLHGTPHTFGNDADTIQVVVNDGGNTGSGGGTDQTIGTVNVDITGVNDEQVLATNAGATVVEGSIGNFVTTAMLETTDVDNTDSQLVYTVDALPSNGTLLLSGSALDVNDTFTQADIDAGLVAYDHDGSEATTDSFGFTVDDGAGTTTSSTFNWTILPVNDAPVEASIEGSTLAYTENDGAVAITSTLALGDVDDTNLESAVVQITGNYASGQDVLSFVDQNGISGVWNAGSGTMTLSGTATVAEYEAALRSITYTNSSDNPSTATRTVSFTVNDGDVDSNTQTRDISIAATNDDPTGTGLPSDITVTEDVSSNVDLSALNLSDLDENGGNLTVTLSTSTGGDLSASTGGGVTVGGSGTGTLILTGSLADLNTFLDTPANVQYLHGTPNTFGNDADTIQVVVNDGGNTGSGGGTDQTIGTVNVDITAVNDEQVLATNAGDTVAEGSTGNTVTTAMLETTDIDNTDSQLVYTVDALPTNGTLYRNAVVLNVNDTFTQADIDANLITYDHDGSETSSDSFDFTVDDGAGTTTSDTFNWTITGGNDAPLEASIEGSTLAYTENDGAVAITSTLALSDADDTNLESAVVQITGNYANGQDVLTFVDQNGISGVWITGSGTMTLTGTATVTQYEAALRSITYTNTSDNPSTATRTVSFTVNDGDVNSNTQTRDISIAATNDDPTGTGLPSDITVSEDVSSNVDLSALNLSDLDENGGNLTVTLTTSTGGDLSASTGGGVTVGGSGSGTLTLTGTLSDLNTFLDTPANVQYLHGTPHTFGNDADTIQVVVNDNGNTGSGGGTDQTIGTVNVDITAVNDEQVVATNVGATVVEGSIGNFLTTAMLETTDVDNTDTQLIYTVDALPTSGTLLLSGSALDVNDTFTQADIDAGLVAYDHDGSEATTDSFDFTVDDSAGAATSSTFNWTILPVNDAPVESSIEGSTLGYTENDGAVAITSTLALSDVDDTNLESAVVQITGNYANGQDVLTFVDQNGISGVWNAGSGSMTLTGTATVAQYEAALRSITYTNGSDDPSTAIRTVSFTVNDGDVDSNTLTRDISVAATNDDPTGTGLPSDITVSEDVSSNVDLSALNLSDLDENGGNLTVTLSTSTGGGLSASTGGGVTVGGSGTGTLILTGSLADLNTFLDMPANVQYLHGTPHTFGNDADTIQVVINDGGNTGSGGGTDQTIGTVNVDITAVNDEQVLATNAGDTVAEGSTGNTVTTAMLETTDVDNTDSQLVYTVDVLPSNGTLYRSGVVLNVSDTFTQADIDANLITYDHDGSGTTSDSFDFTVDDGAGTTTSSTFNWTVTAVNDAPVEASIEGSTLAYSENGGAVAITSTLALSDVDDTNLESAVIQITGNYANGQDVLTFVDQNGISGVWNAGSGTMTLTGTATVAQYEAALRSITYTNTSDNPSTATRTVAFTVNDGDVDSNTQTRDISIAATNDDPMGTGLPSDITVTEDVSSNVDLSALSLSDLDDNGGNLTVTLSTSTGGDLSASTGGGVTVGGSGTGTLTLTGSLADLNTFLDTPANVQYLHGTPHTFGNDADTIQVVVNDGGNTGSGGGTDQTIGTVNVDITGVNDAPTTSPVALIAIAEDSGVRTITQAELLSAAGDVEGDALTATGLAISSGSGALVDNGDGTWDYTPAANDDTSVSFSYTISDGTDSAAGIATLEITAVNDSPTLVSNTGTTVAEGQTGVTITSAMLSSLDLDDSGAGLTYTITDAVDNGTLALSGFGTLGLGATFTQADLDNGDVTYSHDGSETIIDAFGFSLADGGEDGAIAVPGTFNFVVTPVDDNAISVISDIDLATNSVAENSLIGTVVGVTAFANDLDAGDSVSYSLDDDAGGRFAIDASSGVVSVAGSLDFETSASENITVRATSTDGSNATLVVSLSITNVNEAPSASGESFAVAIGETLSVGVSGVIANDTDIDGDSLAIVLVSGPTNGTFTLNPGGNFSYTPNVGFFGQDSFFYRVTDGSLSSNIAEVVLEVPVVAPSVSGTGSIPEPETDTATDPESDPPVDVESQVEESGEVSDTTEITDADTGVTLDSVLQDAGTKPHGNTDRHRELSDAKVNERLPEEELIEAEQQLYGVYAVAGEATNLVLSYSPELQQLERLLRQDLQQAIVWTQWDDSQEQDETPMTMMVGAAGAGMSVFSIGYVFWALRGGALMTVLASSLPAWRFIDPIAMLSAYRSSKSGVDEGLDGMIN